MKNIGTRTVRWLILLALIAIGLYYFPLTMISNKTREIDVNSGRLRTQSHILYLIVSEHIEATIISKYVRINTNSTPDWRLVQQEVLWPKFLPHEDVWVDPKYNGVPSQMELVRLIWKKSNPTFEERREFTQKVLLLWKESNNDENGAEFVENAFLRTYYPSIGVHSNSVLGADQGQPQK